MGTLTDRTDNRVGTNLPRNLSLGHWYWRSNATDRHYSWWTFSGALLKHLSAAEPATYLRGVGRLLRPPVRSVVMKCIQEAAHTLKTWLLAKALSMTAIGVFVTAGSLALQVPLAGTLGVIAGVLAFIPNIGPIVSVLPAALLAFGMSPTKGILTILLFCLAHLLHGNVVTPLADRRIVRLLPFLTLTMQLLACVAGALGVALAAPLTAVLMALAGVLLRPTEMDKSGPLVLKSRA